MLTGPYHWPHRTSTMSISGVATMAEAEAMQRLTWAPKHRLPHTKAILGTAAPQCPARQQQRPMLSPHVAPFPPGASPLHQALSILEGPLVHLHRDRELFWVFLS